MSANSRFRLAAGAASAIWMAVIFGLSALPGSAVPGHFGTLAHFAVYAVLGGLYFLALPIRPQRWQTVAMAIALASLYGITDEFHQSFVPGRTPDVLDWLVDTAGALTAVVAVEATRRRLARRP